MAAPNRGPLSDYINGRIAAVPDRPQTTPHSYSHNPRHHAGADAQVGIPVSAVDGRFALNLGGLIRRLASETPARKVSSARGCRWCDITKADCPERVEGEAREEGMTEGF